MQERIVATLPRPGNGPRGFTSSRPGHPAHPARCGIAEAWVTDVQERVVRVFRDPSASGYRTSFTASGGESVTALALPAVVVPVAELFPA